MSDMPPIKRYALYKKNGQYVDSFTSKKEAKAWRKIYQVDGSKIFLVKETTIREVLDV